MRQKPILISALISAALLLGAVAPAMAHSPRQQPPPGGETLPAQAGVEEVLVFEEDEVLIEGGEVVLEDGAAVEAVDANQATLDNTTDQGNHHDKPKKVKKKCRDFTRPCKVKRKNRPGLPETVTSYTTANGGVSSAVPKWFYLYSGLSTEAQPLVLTDNSSEGRFGNQLTIEPIQSGNHGQLWMAETLGNGNAYIHSGRGNGLRLSYGGGSSYNFLSCNSQWPAKNYPSQVNSPAGSYAKAMQQWSYSTVATTTIGGETVPLVSLRNANCTSPQQGSCSSTTIRRSPVQM